MTYLLPVILLLSASAAIGGQPQAPKSMADAFMMQLDLNKDGKVDQIEFLTPYEKQFKRMDSNKDGAIDRGEIEAAEKQALERMKAMRQQRQGGQ